MEELKERLQSCPQNHMEQVRLYQGIELYFISAKTAKLSMRRSNPEHILEINYCHSGRVGWKTENGNLIHLGPGDFSLRTLNSCAESSLFFPTKEYEGLTFYIYLHELSAHLPKFLAGTGICGETFYEKFCKNATFTSFAGNEQTEAIFSAFYGQPENLKLAYQKIKTLELLLYLCKPEASQTGRLTEYQSEQIEIVRTVHDQLTQNIGQRITIESLSRQYLINPTTLKEVFKSVYGTSIAAHIKEHRMEQAARLLLETDLSIAKIGRQIGYESQSRFTSTFKAYFQTLPREYRKNHRRAFYKSASD